MKRRRRFLPFLFKLVDEWAPWGSAMLTAVAASTIFAITNIFIYYSPSALAAQIVAVTTLTALQYIQARTKRNNAVLIELTVSYLANGRSVLLDRLLGKLISGTWRREEMKPGNALFKVLRAEIESGDFWKRRRVAEALPMLAAIDLKKTTELIKILREDWSDRWKSDNRRRTIEALYNDMDGHAPLLVNELKPKLVDDLLRLRSGDQVFTAMAAIEAFSLRDGLKASEKIERVSQLLANESVKYSEEEQSALEWLKEFLIDAATTRSSSEALEELRRAVRSNNLFVRVAAARNIIALSKRKPGDTLTLIHEIASDKRPESRNARRPLAKEKCIRFVMDCASAGDNRELAREILQSLLVRDPDDIIRITAFDEIEYLIERNIEVARSICVDVLAEERNEELRERAARTLDDIDNPERL